MARHLSLNDVSLNALETTGNNTGLNDVQASSPFMLLKSAAASLPVSNHQSSQFVASWNVVA